MRVIVLGSAQDAGVPQLFCSCPNCEAARDDPRIARTASSVAVLHAGRAWLLDASPDLRTQWDRLPRGTRLAGLVLTHAHAGHVAGLGLLGKEGPDVEVPLVATPSLIARIESTAPWRHVASRMTLVATAPGARHDADGLRFTLHPLVHRAELSDTVAIEVDDGKRRVCYLPDTDAWDDAVEAAVARLGPGDTLLFDGTFWSLDEVRHRDATQIPHPPVCDTLEHLSALASRGVHVVLTHLNHTNPLLDPTSEAAMRVAAHGIMVAAEGMELGFRTTR